MLNHVPSKDLEVRRRLGRTDTGKTEPRIFAELAEFEEKLVSDTLKSLIAEGIVEDSASGYRLRKETGHPQSPTK